MRSFDVSFVTELFSAVLHGGAAGLATGAVLLLSDRDLMGLFVVEEPLIGLALGALACAQTGVAAGLGVWLGAQVTKDR